jgi:ADP-ribose pyrophosphatase YjhB (NUDIX family)
MSRTITDRRMGQRSGMNRTLRDRQAGKARDVTHEAQGWPKPPKPPLHRRMIRRLFHLGFLLMRPMTLGVRAVVLDAKERVLLVRHTYMSGWYFPGGGVETGETSLEALTRELREEAAIEVIGEPQWHGLFFNRHASRRDHVGLYIVRTFRDLGPRKPDREILEARFFPLDALPPDLAYGHQRRLHEIRHGLPAHPDW